MAVVIASDAPATSSAMPDESNCMKAAIAVAAAVIPRPRQGMMGSSPAAAARAPAVSTPIRRKSIEVGSATAGASRAAVRLSGDRWRSC
jgi:hypothetical protein